MNDHARWMEANEKNLAAELAWLRLRLEKMAGPGGKSVEPVVEKPRGFFASLFGTSSHEPASPPEVSGTSLVPRDTEIVEAEQALI